MSELPANIADFHEVVRFAADPSNRFAAIHAAEKWATDNGYRCGSMQGDSPICLMRAAEYSYIAKWRNLADAERRAAHGLILGGNSRDPIARVLVRK